MNGAGPSNSDIFYDELIQDQHDIIKKLEEIKNQINRLKAAKKELLVLLRTNKAKIERELYSVSSDSE